jgi:hypothetical protein
MFFQINTDKKQIRTFGIGLAVFLCIFASIYLYKHGLTTAPKILFGIAPVIFLLSLLSPKILKPIYIPLTFIAHCIGWVMSKIILGIQYYLIFTPISLFFRVIGKDLLDREYDFQKKSYWYSKSDDAPNTPESMEKQF